MKEHLKDYRIEPGSKARLKDRETLPPKSGDGFKDEVKARTAELGLRLAALQEILHAEHRRRVLVVLQGMDTSGKDGTTRTVFREVCPAGLRVVSFKGPTQPELERDYLWRIHAEVPRDGEIAVFNRSHYEDVLAVRVHGLKPEKVWRRRYRHIVEFERMLVEEGSLVLKFFLHISKDEQRRRLEGRLTDERKRWKWDPSDLRDREAWEAFQTAYGEALELTSTSEAPWMAVPADKKWWRDYVVSQALVSALEDLDMKLPKPKLDVARIHLK